MEMIHNLIVALDFDTLEEADALVRSLEPFDLCYKIGLQLLTAVGPPAAVNFLQERGANVFLDGKFHDIGNTMGKAAAAAAKLGVTMFNVHASAGLKGMKAAAENKGKSLLLAVTVLTSHDEEATKRIFRASKDVTVLEFARDAKDAGCDGVICSGQELSLLGGWPEFKGFLKVTPAIRPKWAAHGDQERVMTPAEAILAGADALVIGRPITNPPREVGTPQEAVKRILWEMDEAYERRKVSS
jgi:orotidine-5'-phosphate decarboxylase